MQRVARIFAVILFAVLFLGISSIAQEEGEKITLTTYYPAPWGAYEELRANKLAVGLETVIGVPTTDGDLEASGTIRANTRFNIDGTDGDTDTYTVITNAKIAGPNIQLKTRTITVIGGIITDIGDETPNWTNGPL